MCYVVYAYMMASSRVGLWACPFVFVSFVLPTRRDMITFYFVNMYLYVDATNRY